MTRKGFTHMPCSLLALACVLLSVVPVHAQNIKADISGMHIEIIAPWYLFTNGTRGNEPFYFRLTKTFEDGAMDEIGTGGAVVCPAKKGKPFITQDQIKNLDAKQLQSFIQDFEKQYPRSSQASTELAVTEHNGFTAILCKEMQKGMQEVPEPCSRLPVISPFTTKWLCSLPRFSALPKTQRLCSKYAALLSLGLLPEKASVLLGPGR